MGANTIGGWVAKCVPDAMKSRGLSFFTSISSSAFIADDVVPLLIQTSAVLDGCIDSLEVCACKVAKVVTVAAPTLVLHSILPGGGSLVGSALMKAIAPNLWECQ